MLCSLVYSMADQEQRMHELRQMWLERPYLRPKTYRLTSNLHRFYSKLRGRFEDDIFCSDEENNYLYSLYDPEDGPSTYLRFLVENHIDDDYDFKYRNLN